VNSLDPLFLNIVGFRKRKRRGGGGGGKNVKEGRSKKEKCSQIPCSGYCISSKKRKEEGEKRKIVWGRKSEKKKDSFQQTINSTNRQKRKEGKETGKEGENSWKNGKGEKILLPQFPYFFIYSFNGGKEKKGQGEEKMEDVHLFQTSLRSCQWGGEGGKKKR